MRPCPVCGASWGAEDPGIVRDAVGWTLCPRCSDEDAWLEARDADRAERADEDVRAEIERGP